MNILVTSENYTVYHEWEVVYLLHKKSGRETVIGDFYGDPQCAFITEHESWCIIGGAGVIAYRLKEPFTPYGNISEPTQWMEFHRKADDLLWIENIYQSIFDNEIRLVADPLDKRNGVYALRVDKGTLKKITTEYFYEE